MILRPSATTTSSPSRANAQLTTLTAVLIRCEGLEEFASNSSTNVLRTGTLAVLMLTVEISKRVTRASAKKGMLHTNGNLKTSAAKAMRKLCGERIFSYYLCRIWKAQRSAVIFSGLENREIAREKEETDQNHSFSPYFRSPRFRH